MKDRTAEIEAANGEVFGISVDSPFSQSKWSEQEGFTTTFLSDLGKDVSRTYGTFYEELLGLKGVSKRSAFLIDKTGTIVAKDVRDDAKEITDIEGMIAKMKGLG